GKNRDSRGLERHSETFAACDDSVGQAGSLRPSGTRPAFLPTPHGVTMTAGSRTKAIVSLLLLAGCAFAQPDLHVQWSLAVEREATPPGAPVLGRLTGILDPGWHLYSMSTAAAMPTTILLADNPVAELHRVLQPPPKRAFDPN